MRIRVALLPLDLDSEAAATAIVIDTLRFTTTAAQALYAGATAIHVGSTIEEAQELAARNAQGGLLCGERLCKPIPGFDLGNSPWEYTAASCGGRELFFTTTNGTKAIASVLHCNTILLAALVNRRALGQRLLENPPTQLDIICAGTDGRIALEDVLAAGAIVDWLDRNDQLQCSVHGDAAEIALHVWRGLGQSENAPYPATCEAIRTMFTRAQGGANLIEAGYTRDLDFASRLDRLDCVPQSDCHRQRVFIA